MTPKPPYNGVRVISGPMHVGLRFSYSTLWVPDSRYAVVQNDRYGNAVSVDGLLYHTYPEATTTAIRYIISGSVSSRGEAYP